MKQKQSPFTFFDTHAGSGRYRLADDIYSRTGEAASGITRILETPDYPELLDTYISLCRNMHSTSCAYPGSPELARSLSRPIDSLVLMELHPSEIPVLKANFHTEKRVHIHHRDGFSGLIALTPPATVRGIAHIDPSYETAEDWQKTADTLISVSKRWPAGILAAWYPVVGRKLNELKNLENRLTSSGISGILKVQLEVEEALDSPDGYGLSGSGMFIINPPWTLHDELQKILPWLAKVLGERKEGSWGLDWLSKPV